MSYRQIQPQYRKTRWAVLTGGVIYVATAGALHFFIGSLADWTTTLAPLLGREDTAALVQAQYGALPAFEEACRRANVPYTAFARPGMIHCYCMLPYFREAKEDFARITDILKA